MYYYCFEEEKIQIYKFDKYKPNYMHFGVEELHRLINT